METLLLTMNSEWSSSVVPGLEHISSYLAQNSWVQTTKLLSSRQPIIHVDYLQPIIHEQLNVETPITMNSKFSL